MTVIDKQTAARYMINCAIRNVLNGECPVSTHVLVLSAKEILQGVAQSTGVKLSLDPAEMVRPEERLAFRRVLKERYNFFKHADKDHDFEIDITNIQRSNEMELILVMDNYRDLYGLVSRHMLTFQLFFMLMYPDIFDFEKGKVSDDDMATLHHWMRELTKDGRTVLCAELEKFLASEPVALKEREEARSLSCAEVVTLPLRDCLEGPFFKRQKPNG